MVQIRTMITTMVEAVKKHDNEIYGNGRDGLKTSASLIKDDVKGLKIGYQNLKDKVSTMPKEIMIRISSGVFIIIAILGFMLRYMIK